MSDNISRETILQAVESNVGKERRPFGTGDNYDSGNAPAGDRYDTAQAQELFKFLAFGAPLVRVQRKSDGVIGTLEFTHSPRVYFGFVPDDEQR